MTTTVIAHLPPDQKKRLLVETFDRVYDHDKKVMTHEWRKVDHIFVDAGRLVNTYCTDTRRVLISEVELPQDTESTSGEHKENR